MYLVLKPVTHSQVQYFPGDLLKETLSEAEETRLVEDYQAIKPVSEVSPNASTGKSKG